MADHKPEKAATLDALFSDDLDDSDDSDDESYEVDEDDVESDDDVIRDDSDDGGGGHGGAAAASSSGGGGSARLASADEEHISTLIQNACKAGDHAELERLLKFAATPVQRQLIDGSAAPPAPAYNVGELVHARDDWDVAPLHSAILARSLECVDLLLARGASVSERHEGFSYLHTAIAVGTLRRNREFSRQCVARLLAKDAPLDIEDVQGFTPLHFAAYHGDDVAAAHVVEAAVARSADAVLEEGERAMLQRLVDARSHGNETAVGVALRRGHAGIAAALVKVGARPQGGGGGGDAEAAVTCVRAAPHRTAPRRAARRAAPLPWRVWNAVGLCLLFVWVCGVGSPRRRGCSYGSDLIFVIFLFLGWR